MKILKKLLIQQDDKNIPLNQYNPAYSFLHIHELVEKQWGRKILNILPEKIRTKQKIDSQKGYTSYKIGFFQMCLAENSGVKISPLNQLEQRISNESRLYIIDPELQYVKKNTEKPFSITSIIDKIFEKFQQIIDDKFQGLFGIRFFLRRTLGGCEFGVCVQPLYEFEYDDENDNAFLNCLIDREPLIMFTICTKTSIFWLSGILMIILVFVSSLCCWIGNKFLENVRFLKTIKSFIHRGINLLTSLFKKDDDDESDNGNKNLMNTLADQILDKIIEKLQKKISKNLKKYDLGLGVIFDTFLNFVCPINTESFNDKIGEKIFAKMKLNEKVNNYISNCKPFGKLIKIGSLIVLYIAIFAMNLKHKISLKFESTTMKSADSYQKERKKKAHKDLVDFDSYHDVQSKFG